MCLYSLRQHKTGKQNQTKQLKKRKAKAKKQTKRKQEEKPRRIVGNLSRLKTVLFPALGSIL